MIRARTVVVQICFGERCGQGWFFNGLKDAVVCRVWGTKRTTTVDSTSTEDQTTLEQG
jgi:hypothetical protein